jgi:hypothetical protein
MSTTRPIDLSHRADATTMRFMHNDPVWFRQAQRGGYGFTRLVPGFFDGYGNVRVGIVLRDVLGHDHRVFVDPRNVFPRLVDDVPAEVIR